MEYRGIFFRGSHIPCIITNKGILDDTSDSISSFFRAIFSFYSEVLILPRGTRGVWSEFRVTGGGPEDGLLGLDQSTWGKYRVHHYATDVTSSYSAK